jgi:hypothetical protein
VYQQQMSYPFASTSVGAEVQSQLDRLARFVPPPGHLSFRVALDEVGFDRRTFQFREPIVLSLIQDEDVWSCEACGIISTGSDPTGAALSFCEDFSVVWDEIAQAPDESLSRDALKTKQCMLAVIKSVL